MAASASTGRVSPPRIGRSGSPSSHGVATRSRLLLEQDGVTYNAANARNSTASSRSWTLDPVPFIVPAGEWATIERGMIQRAELLDLVLERPLR